MAGPLYYDVRSGQLYCSRSGRSRPAVGWRISWAEKVGRKGVRMICLSPGTGGSGWYARLCPPQRAVPIESGRSTPAHQTPSAAHRSANPDSIGIPHVRQKRGRKGVRMICLSPCAGGSGWYARLCPPQRAVPIESGHTEPRPPRTVRPIPIPSGFLR